MFNGYWGIEPQLQDGKPVGCKVVVTQEVLPSMVPPGPLGMLTTRSYLLDFLLHEKLPINALSGKKRKVSIFEKRFAGLVVPHLVSMNKNLLWWGMCGAASYVSKILGNQVKAVLQDLSVEAERVQKSKISAH